MLAFKMRILNKPSAQGNAPNATVSYAGDEPEDTGSGDARDIRLLQQVDFAGVEGKPGGPVVQRPPLSRSVGDKSPEMSHHVSLDVRFGSIRVNAIHRQGGLGLGAETFSRFR